MFTRTLFVIASELRCPIFSLNVPANCLWTALAFSFSEDLIVMYCCEGPQGSPGSLIYFCHSSVCYRGEFPRTREAERTFRRCQEVFLSATLMLIQSRKNTMEEKKVWDGRGWPLSFLWKGFIPVPQTTSARLKCLALWHVAEEMVVHLCFVSFRDTKREK